MRISRAFFEMDTLLALLVLVVTAAYAIRGYRQIVGERGRGGLLMQPISLGTFSYAVRHRGQCAGFITSSLVDEAGTRSLKGDGQLRLRVNDQLWPVTLKAEANFNLLGQMGGGFIEMETSRGRIMLAGLDIDPVTVIFRINSPERSFEHRFIIPGPFELRPVSLNAFQLHYAHLQTSGSLGALPSALEDRLDISVVPSPGVDAECAGPEGQAIDLEPLKAALRSFAQGFRSFAPKIPGMEQLW